MTEISGAAALPAFRAATQTPSTIQPASMHYARPSAGGQKSPSSSTPEPAPSGPREQDGGPPRLDITV